MKKRTPTGKQTPASKAKEVRSYGRKGDNKLVHMNATELRQMEKKYGKATKNPKTGMPEFFLGALFEKAEAAGATNSSLVRKARRRRKLR